MSEQDDPALPLPDPGIASPGGAPPSPVRRSPVVTVGVVMGLLLVGAVGGLYFQGPLVRAFFAATELEPGGGARHPIARPLSAAADAEVPPVGETVVALGRLQPRGGVVEVASPTTAAAPRVAKVLVGEGDEVVPGQPLVLLDTYAQLMAGRVAAERAVGVAEAALDQVRSDVRSGLGESRAGVEGARVVAEHAEGERARVATLHASGAIADDALEAAEAAAEQAAAELRRVQAVAARFEDAADVRVAEERLAAARADLERADVELATSTVTAPYGGTVLSVEVRAGERAQTGRLLSLGDLSQMEAELEVFQDAVARVAVGQPVRLSSNVLTEGPLLGTVRRVGLTVGRQNLTSTDPAANTDARVVQVLVALDGPSSVTAARFVGLEVVGHIAVDDSPTRAGAGP